MNVSNEYKKLLYESDVGERFRSGDFSIDEDEKRILNEFVDDFFKSVTDSRQVTLEEFTDLMELMDISYNADDDDVKDIIVKIFIKSAEIQNDLKGWKN